MSKAIIGKCGFIAGPSGVGKHYGVGQVLTEYHRAEIFVSGDWCRKHQAESANNGIIVNDEMIEAACLEHFQKVLAQHSGGPVNFLFDAPRTVPQIHGVIHIFRLLGYEGDPVSFHLDTDEKTAFDRLVDRANRQSRADDRDPKVIGRRLTSYYGTVKEEHEGTVISRHEDGIRHEVIPVLKEMTKYRLIDARCLEEVRNQVNYHLAPELLG